MFCWSPNMDFVDPVILNSCMQINLLPQITWIWSKRWPTFSMYKILVVLFPHHNMQLLQCSNLCIPYVHHRYPTSVFIILTLPGPSAGVSGSLDSYCSLKPLCSGMGEVVPARTVPTLLSPSPRTVLSLSCFKVLQCINCRHYFHHARA